MSLHYINVHKRYLEVVECAVDGLHLLLSAGAVEPAQVRQVVVDPVGLTVPLQRVHLRDRQHGTK